MSALHTRFRDTVLAGLSAAAILLSAGAALAQDGEGWPRAFENADGSVTEIPVQPQRILSTAVTITGTLLAVDAPVVASGSAGNGTFFAQWAALADERRVENVWPAGGVDIEAVYAVEPDLIIVSTSGMDSALDQIEAFRAVAPTIVVDYGGQTWQDLAVEIGEAAGIEGQVEVAIDAFDAYVDAAREAITIPEGTANIISFNGPGQDNPIARAGSVHGQLLAALGFTLEDPNPEWHAQPNLREDFVWAPYENLVALTAETTFLLRVDDSGVAPFVNEPTLANLPSVQAGQVYGLGVNSFRIDYFSGREIVDGIVEEFGH
ncbi:Fe2+-enterobactin ABC transporter substrate-binding protein [Pelagibacterium lacus]|uniref:Fe2+-enterobactin ABC transporter substrate-binding protein n=1 Tax=Pelagibacterium lacus TaxID=2282655 RepID=A0A369W1L7_9HYPH|nr:Fe2+-enterobactin ABC transporter substrate-binding protein [Pelagibacterium lacus]RDE07847.1 Fe2+-enterobactin ABC transporter substrate-binding protein [Pelagibacterium lacus]